MNYLKNRVIKLKRPSLVFVGLFYVLSSSASATSFIQSLQTPFYDPNDTGTCTTASPGGSGNTASNTSIDVSKTAAKYKLHSAIVKEVGGAVLGSYNADQSPATVASVLKVIIADAFFSTKPDLSSKVTVTDQENYFKSGGADGSLKNPKPGQKITLSDALQQTLTESSDTDANVLIDQIGGLNKADRLMNSLGYKDTHFNSYYNSAGAGTPNQTTVTDLTAAMEKFFTNTGTNYVLAQKYLRAETVKYGLDSIANKWGGTSKVSGNSAVFEINGKQYIITAYIEQDWKGDAGATNPDSGAWAVSQAIKELVGLINPSSNNSADTISADSSQCCIDSQLTGSVNAEKVYNYLVGKGLSPKQAAGAMGNMQAEAHFEPKLVEYGWPNSRGEKSVQGQPSSLDDKVPPNTGPQGQPGYGIVQWTSPGRKQGLIDMASSKNLPESDLGLQLDYMWSELQNSYYKPNVLDPIMRSSSINDATMIWLSKFEVPGDIAGQYPVRLTMARQILLKYGSNDPSVSSSDASSCGDNSQGETVGNYSLPLDKKWYTQHKDWFTKPHHDYPAADIPVPQNTPVYSISSGKVTSAPVGGSCGNGVMVDAGSGVLFLYCHGQDGGSIQGAKPGDQVKAGQLIMHSGYTGHIEPPGPAGAHLHVQITIKGQNHCPQNLLVGVAEGNPPDINTLPTSGCSY